MQILYNIIILKVWASGSCVAGNPSVNRSVSQSDRRTDRELDSRTSWLIICLGLAATIDKRVRDSHIESDVNGIDVNGREQQAVGGEGREVGS